MDSIVKVFENSAIRFVSHPQGEYRFGVVADDIAHILEVSSGRHLSRLVDEDLKGVHLVDTLGGMQKLMVLWEPGFYQAVGGSRAKKAKPFRNWVYRDLIPTVVATGSYNINHPTESKVFVIPKHLDEVKAKVEAIKQMPGLTLPPAMAEEDPRSLFLAGIQVGIELCKSYLI
jgi:prophage antirepressor-like protein